MKLPYGENAVVAKEKVTDYLLSEEHEHGKNKAAFFLHFGFSIAKWKIMQDELLTHALKYDVSSVVDTARGKHYAVEGEINTPSGRIPRVRTVWALETGSEIPRLITAYPAKAKEGDGDDPRA